MNCCGDAGDCACRATTSNLAWITDASRGGDAEHHKILDELHDLHSEKSGGYGTGKDPYANFSAISALTGQSRYVYPIHRAIEKLSRCLSLIDQGRTDELGEEFRDVSSLLVCAESMRRQD